MQITEITLIYTNKIEKNFPAPNYQQYKNP